MAIVINEIPPEVFNRAATVVIDMLITKYDDLGMRASGNWADELDYDVEGRNMVWITGLAYSEQLAQGRAPGNNPPMEPLQRWFMQKYGVEEQRARGLAFGLQKKIAKEGTSWYQQGGTDLLEVLVSDEATTAFYEIIGEYLRFDIAAALRRELNTLEQ